MTTTNSLHLCLSHLTDQPPLLQDTKFMSMQCTARPETLKHTPAQQAKYEHQHELARNEFKEALAAAKDRVAERAGAVRAAGRSAADQRAAAARKRLAEAEAEAEAAAAAAEAAESEEDEAAAPAASAGVGAETEEDEEMKRLGGGADDAWEGDDEDDPAREGDDEDDPARESDAEESDEARRARGIAEILLFKDKRMRLLYDEWADRRLTQVGKEDPPSQEEDQKWAEETYDSEQERLAKIPAKANPPVAAKKRKLAPGEVGPEDAAWGRGPRIGGWHKSRLSVDEIVQKEHEVAAAKAAAKEKPTPAPAKAVPAKPVRAVAKGGGEGGEGQGQQQEMTKSFI